MNPESQVALPFGEFDHPRGVILDTNVLLLFIAGNANRSLISEIREHYVPSASVAARSDLPRFGLTDLTIDECSGSNVAVITDDGPLYHFLVGRGVPAINFTHHRDMSIR